jgi:uncharacterized membrane protein YidH (DUF202 family)
LAILIGWEPARWLNKPSGELLEDLEGRSDLLNKLKWLFWIRTALAFICFLGLRVVFGVHDNNDGRFQDMASLSLPVFLIPVGNLVMGFILLMLTKPECKAQTAKDLGRPFRSSLLFLAAAAVSGIPYLIFHKAYDNNFRGYSHSALLVLNGASIVYLWVFLILFFAYYQAPIYQLRARDGHLLLPAFCILFVTWMTPIEQGIYGALTGAVNPLNQISNQLPPGSLVRFGSEWAGPMSLTLVCLIEISIAQRNGITISGGSRLKKSQGQ